MLMTVKQFADEYDVIEKYVNFAIQRAGIQPAGRVQVHGRSARQFEERDLTNAMKNYFIGLRDNMKAKADRWHNEALGVKRHYERRHRRADDGSV